MGYLKSIGTTIIYIGAILAAITFIPGIPPDANFAEYSIVSPKELPNNLASNNRLNNAQLLFQGQVKGPESFASYNGELYTGVHGGYVIKITDNKIIPIVKFGKECDGHWQESKCGRPLDLKFDEKGALFVCDAYYGIFKVDVKTGKYQQLVNIKEPIEGQVPMLINSLDVASNGDIYWSDSSTEFQLQDGVYSMLTNPTGRLIKYNAATKKNQVLVQNLGFANGVAISEDETFVIVSESLASRITKYNIKGPKAGKTEVMAEGLPGLPDNIFPDNQNGFLVSLIAVTNSQHPVLFQSLIPHPYIRRMLVRLLTLIEAPFKCMQSYYPNYYAERIVHYLGGFESVNYLASKNVTVLRIDSKGNIIDAAHNTDEKISGISSSYIHNGFLWLGSPYNEYIAKVPLKQAFPDLDVKEKRNTKSKNQEESIDKNKNSNIPKEKKQNSSTKTPTPAKATTEPPTKSTSKAPSNKQKSSHNNEKRSPKK